MIESMADGGRPCTKESDPMCGSNNQTYGNQCTLCDASEQNSDLNLTLKYPGRCEDGPVEYCMCPADLQLECGTDNVTYSNKCLRVCKAITDKKPCLLRKHMGECDACDTPASATGA